MPALSSVRPGTERLMRALVVLLLAGLCFAASYSEGFQGIERWALQQASRLAPAAEAPARVAVVAVDVNSLDRLGDWPWPRSRIAQLLDRLSEAEVSAVGLALPFTYPETSARLDELLAEVDEGREQLRARIQELREAPRTGSARARERRADQLDRLREGEQQLDTMTYWLRRVDTDDDLARALQRSGVTLLGAGYQEVGPAEAEVLPEDLATVAVPEALGPFARPWLAWLFAPPAGPQGLNVQLPIGRLREAAAGTAVNPVGAAAQPGARILIEQDDRGLASLPLAVAATAMGIPPTAVQMPPGGGLRMGELRFDLGPDRRFYPLAGGAGELPVYSAADVLAREVAATELRGRAVIIGALTGDAGGPLIAAAAVASPLDLAAALQGLLSQRYVRIEDWYFGAQRALLLALALLLVLPPARYVAGGAGIAVSLLLGLVLINAALVALLTRQFWLPVTLGVGFLWGAHLLLIGLARLEAALGRWRHEASEARRLLGLNLQAQGQLDQAFEALSAIPATESVVHHLYDLGLDYERRRQFSRALTVYEHISARRPKYRDIAARSTRLRSVTSPSPLAGADGGGNASATLVLSDSGLEKPRIGRYEVEAQIGRGAMGIVYLGRDPKIGRQVAIKALNLAQEFDAEELEEVKMRFYREAEASGRLNHPGIVQVYDIGEEHDLAYIAMDYVQGEPLDRHTRPGSLLAVEAVLEIGSQVAEALDYAHGQQVIHRDIKPANIMYEPESGVAKLTDFGIACLTDNANTRTGTLIGTPAYMSPEQVAGKRVDGRSDLFSLGSTLFQLLVGRLPFSGESMANLVYKIGGEAHPKARSLRPELTAAIERVLDTALAKAPEDRYESGAAMAAALRKALSGWQGRGKKAAEQTRRR